MRRLAILGLILPAACVVPAETRNVRHLEQGDEEFLLERYAQAIAYYELFLSENPQHPDRAKILTRIGKCHLGAGDLEAALRSFDHARASNPDGPTRCEIAFRRGVAYRTMGDTARALEALREAAGAPEADRGRALMDDEFHYEYAMALMRAGDWAAGQAELAAVSPGGPFGAKRQVRLGLTSFAVQVGVFTDEMRARTQEARLKAVHPGGSVRLAPGERSLYVVSAGPFARWEDAQREAERLRTRGFPDAFVVP